MWTSPTPGSKQAAMASSSEIDDPFLQEHDGSDDEDDSDTEEEEESDEEEELELGSMSGSVSDQDRAFDPLADGNDEVEAVLRSRLSKLSLARGKTRKGSGMPEMDQKDIDIVEMVEKLMQDGQMEKLKVDQCKAYLRMYKLRLSGKKEVLLSRIREHLEVKNGGEDKYPVSSFVLNCKGDACKGDVVMFEQNIYKKLKRDSRNAKGRLCGQRTNAGRIIKESYGTTKQQHTFTIEVLWSKGYKPWPPLHQLLIKGRNLYKDKTMRQPWADEDQRKKVLQEKHARGFLARRSRDVRIQEKEMKQARRVNRLKDNKSKEQEKINPKSSQEALPQQRVQSMHAVHQRTEENKSGENINRVIPSQEALPRQKVLPMPHKENDEEANRYQQISRHILPQQTFQSLQQPQYRSHSNKVLQHKMMTRTDRRESINQQNTSYQAAQLHDSTFQACRMFPQHAKPQYGNQTRSSQGYFTERNGCCSYGHGEVHAHHQMCRPPGPSNHDFHARHTQYGQSNYGDRQMTQCSDHPKWNQPWEEPQQKYSMPQRQQCRYYRQGRCYYGENCKYFHDN